MQKFNFSKAIDRRINPDGSKSVKMTVGGPSSDSPLPLTGGRRPRPTGRRVGQTLGGVGPILKSQPQTRPARPKGPKAILKVGPSPTLSAVQRRLTGSPKK